MTKGWIVAVVIVGVILAVGAFIYLNQPTQLLIRKSFRAIFGIEMIKTEDLKELRSRTKLLEEEIKQSREREEKAIEREKEALLWLEESRVRERALVNNLHRLQGELAQARAAIKYLSPEETLVEWDGWTIGEEDSKLIMYEGNEQIITGIDRVKDALGQMRENEKRQEIIISMEELLEEKRNQLLQMEIANTELRVQNIEKEQQLLKRDEQLQKWQDSHASAIQKGRNLLYSGVAVAAIGILVVIFN